MHVTNTICCQAPHNPSISSPDGAFFQVRSRSHHQPPPNNKSEGPKANLFPPKNKRRDETELSGDHCPKQVPLPVYDNETKPKSKTKPTNPKPKCLTWTCPQPTTDLLLDTMMESLTRLQVHRSSIALLPHEQWTEKTCRWCTWCKVIWIIQQSTCLIRWGQPTVTIPSVIRFIPVESWGNKIPDPVLKRR